MKKQRKTKNLGTNQANKHENIYLDLESKGILTKKCSRSSESPHPTYGFIHEGENPISIREFNLQSSSKDGLQLNCRNCEKKYRRGRINKNKMVYAKLNHEDIYIQYSKKYGQEYKICGRCGLQKSPSEFPISKTMESGLHNQCFDCQDNYRESVSDRWIKFTPDGHTVNKPNEAKNCFNCESTQQLEFDHKWPIAKGGTDHPENFQVLCKKCNQEKKVDVSEFNSVHEIKVKQICTRYIDILISAQKENLSILDFEIKITSAVQNHLIWKCTLNAKELTDYFNQHKKINNRKFNIKRAVDKYSLYCSRNSIKKIENT